MSERAGDIAGQGSNWTFCKAYLIMNAIRCPAGEYHFAASECRVTLLAAAPHQHIVMLSMCLWCIPGVTCCHNWWYPQTIMPCLLAVWHSTVRVRFVVSPHCLHALTRRLSSDKQNRDSSLNITLCQSGLVSITICKPLSVNRRETVLWDIRVSKAPCTFFKLLIVDYWWAYHCIPLDTLIYALCCMLSWTLSFAPNHISFFNPSGTNSVVGLAPSPQCFQTLTRQMSSDK